MFSELYMSLYPFVTIAISLFLSVCLGTTPPFPVCLAIFVLHLVITFLLQGYLSSISGLVIIYQKYLIPSISNCTFAADSRKRIPTSSVISRNIQWGITEYYLPNHVYAEHGLVFSFFSMTICCLHIVCVYMCFQDICFKWYMVAVSAWFQVINDLLDPTGQNLRVREDSQVSHCTLILFKTLVLLLFHLFLYLPIFMSLLLYFNLFSNTRPLIFQMLLEYRVYVLLHDQWRCSLSEDWCFNLSKSFSFIKIFSFMLKQWVRVSLKKVNYGIFDLKSI